MSPGGKVYLVGAGPGDPELITLKGVRVLSQADVVVYDRLVPRELLNYAKTGAELVYAGKQPRRHAMSQDEINELLVKKASQGLIVARLKGGDPLIYGRGDEECVYVRTHMIPCEVIPGIPSFIGASSEYLLPLGSRGYSRIFSVATGTVVGDQIIGSDRLKYILQATDSLVILMGARKLYRILGIVRETVGDSFPVALIENATTPESRITMGTVEELSSANIRASPPLLIYLGGAVKWRIHHENALH
ncbi:MAG: uroporphyrinogen-III C-methyltransferase [Desulfurococcales archaeon]|nr:uroporphyrinogen-III C-methyltransferase [Desulfurococcales archaeon]